MTTITRTIKEIPESKDGINLEVKESPLEIYIEDLPVGSGETEPHVVISMFGKTVTLLELEDILADAKYLNKKL